MKKELLASIAFTLVLASANAQTSTASATIDNTGYGCQNANATLTGGAPAAAVVDLSYDQSTHVLSMTVTNTTPLVAGEATATISDVYFNVPSGAITSATLLTQTGSGGATPGFTLTFTAAGTSVACLGTYKIQLDSGTGAQGGIANAAAPLITTPNPVTGPVTFDIELSGPGADGISAGSILASSSMNGLNGSSIGMKFQGGGLGGIESGLLGSGRECVTSVYTVGATSPGQTFDLCVNGDFGCHACLWLSLTPGPVTVGSFDIPIGLPIVAAFTFGNFGFAPHGTEICVPVSVPNNPAVSGFTFYATNVTFDAFNPTAITFSPAATITIN